MTGQLPEPLQQVAIQDGQGHELKSRVHAIEGSEVVFGLAGGAWIPPVNSDVCLRWSSWRGMHECAGHRLVDPDGVLRVRVHESPTCLQRRQYARVPASVPVRLHLDGGQSLDAVSLDLSEGGLRLVLRSCPGLPEELLVELATLPPPGTLQLARVVRQDEADGTTTLVLAFVPPVAQAKALRRTVLARQARNRLLGV